MLKRRPFLSGLFSILTTVRFSCAAEADEQKPAFEPGEKLKYSLGWQFIVAGYAMLEVLPDEEFGGQILRSFRLTARTRKIVDSIFKVRDSISALSDYEVTRSMGYTKIQREGKTKRDITVDFDWNNLKAHYFEALKGKSQITDILENTLDPLSAFYYVRNQKLDVGTKLEGPMTDGKRCKIAHIEVLERKTIKVNGKKYDCLRLKPYMADLGGVFEKSKDAKIEVWCTADHRHIPVLMKSRVSVGSFKVELIPDDD